jgi:simple sugar transport system substrate-binding protein
MLEKYGSDFDVLFSHNDAMMYGALDAFGEYGVTPGKDVIVISVDGEQEAIDLLKEGKVNCVVECTPMLGEALCRLQGSCGRQTGGTGNLFFRAGVY